MRRLSRLVALSVAIVVAHAFAAPAAAQSTTGPTVAIDRAEVSVGEALVLTIAGFQSRAVTISVCGNEARRGSVDCDMTGSLARETQPDAPVGTDLVVTAPPAACPCIIRVSSQDNREIAVAPVVLIGHPVADVVGGTAAGQPLAIDIVANPAPAGVGDQIRSSLGGATTYDVTVRVTNTAPFEIPSVGVAATFSRSRFDDTRNIELPDPDRLAPGATWEQTVPVEVPSLTFGEVEWTATASGQGPSVSATDTTSSQPILLYLLAAVLVVDLLILLWRVVARARRRGAEGDWEPQLNPFLDDADLDEFGGFTDADRSGDQRGSQLVGEPGRR